MNKTFIIFLILMASCTSSPRNAKYLDPDISAEAWNKGLQNPDKDIVIHRDEILNHLPVKKGDSIADVGAGTGQFEKGLSSLVGTDGKVYAIEVAPAFIPFMKERFQKEDLKNVEVVHGETEKTTLPKKSVNLILVVDTYHHFDKPLLMLKDFSKILRPKGHLVIIDFKRGPEARAWVNEHMHLTKEDIIKEVTENGFDYLREENIPFKESFQLTFRKK